MALLRKVAPLPAAPSPQWPKKDAAANRSRRRQGEAAAEGAEEGAGKPERDVASYTYVAVPPALLERCASVAAAAGVPPSAKAARRLLKGRLFQRGAYGRSIVYLSADCERICCGVRGGTPAPPMNVVNAGATVFKRSRPLRGGGEGSLTLTAVGRSLLERLASQSAS